MFRILLVIFALFPCVALGQDSDPVEPNQGNIATEEPASNRVEIISEPIESIRQFMEAIALNTAPDENAQQDQAERQIEGIALSELDLDAQQSMAKYTRLIYLVTAAGLIVGTLTIIALGISISQTRSIIRQDRAWVVYEMRDMDFENAGAGVVAIFTTHWKNAGDSPATGLRIEHRIASFEIAEIGQTIPKFTPTGEWDVMGVLGPGITEHTHLHFTEEAQESLRNGSRRIFIYTCINYKNIYDIDCLTERVEEVTYHMRNEAGGILIQYSGTQQMAT